MNRVVRYSGLTTEQLAKVIGEAENSECDLIAYDPITGRRFLFECCDFGRCSILSDKFEVKFSEPIEMQLQVYFLWDVVEGWHENV